MTPQDSMTPRIENALLEYSEAYDEAEMCARDLKTRNEHRRQARENLERLVKAQHILEKGTLPDELVLTYLIEEMRISLKQEDSPEEVEEPREGEPAPEPEPETETGGEGDSREGGEESDPLSENNS